MSLARSAVALSVLACLAFIAPVRAADNYKVDPVHSSVIFRIQHAGVSYFYGRFNEKEGTITVDEADPTKDSFDVSIKVDSFDSANPARDKHVKSADFFSAQEFPTIQFKSKSVKPAGDKKFDVTGDLTLHGTTKEITVTLEQTGNADVPRMGHRIGFEGSFTIKRSDYGMNKMLDLLGDEIKLMISLEAQKQ
jgi:polyisoprenoid-binding protein YceI